MPSNYLNLDGLDWSDWIRGIVAGFIGGGAGAVSSAFGAMIADPERLNLQHPKLLLESMCITFMVTGVLNMMAYLHQNPVPAVKTVTTTTVTEKPAPSTTITTRVEETKVEPAPAQKGD